MSFVDPGSDFSPSPATSLAELPGGEDVSNRAERFDTLDEFLNESSDALKGMVPRDRIELPTRGFSIRCSTN